VHHDIQGILNIVSTMMALSQVIYGCHDGGFVWAEGHDITPLQVGIAQVVFGQLGALISPV